MNEEPLSPDHKTAFLAGVELKRPGLSLLSAFVAGAVLMLTWWRVQDIGWRWSLSVITICLFYIVNIRLQQREIPKTSWVLMGLTILLGTITTLRSEDFTYLLSMPVTVVSLLLLTADFYNGQWLQLRLREYFKAAFQAIAAFFVGFPVIAAQTARSSAQDPEQRTTGKRVAFGVFKGIVIAIPLLLIFIFLFAYADAVFESKIDALFEWLKADFLSQLVGRIMLTLFFTWLLAAALWLLITQSKRKDLEPDQSLLKPFLGMTETTIVLVSLNLLFAFFLIIQFQYFFAGQANITTNGFTYAQYADRGFRELLLAASIAGVVFFALASFTRRESKTKRLLFTVLGGLLLLQVGVILVSAHQRIVMYIDAYGLTGTRLVSQIFVFFLAAILLSLVMMEVTNKLKHTALVLLAAAMLFSLTLALVNVDTVLARHNIERALEGEELDYSFLANLLSTDAEPYLFGVVQAGSLPPDYQENLEKLLTCRAAAFEDDHPPEEVFWMDLNISAMRAKKLYTQNQDLLAQWSLEIIGTERYFQGITIEGQEIFCSPAN